MNEFHTDQFGSSTRVRVEVGGSRRRGGGRPLILSMLFFLPGLPLAGMAGGLRSLASSNGSKTKAGLAVMLGLVITLAQGLIGFRGYQYVEQLQDGPDRALRAGTSGDVDRMCLLFGPQGPNRNSAEAFLAELEERYGRLLSVELPGGTVDALLAVPSLSHEYAVVFDRGVHDAVVEFEFVQEPGVGYLKPHLASIRVVDPAFGDLLLSGGSGLSGGQRTVAESQREF